MNRYLLLTIAVTGLLACQQQGRQPGNTAADSSHTQADHTTAPSFYLQLKGTVAEQPVTMQLLKTGPDVYRGYYCYDKIGEPIGLWGNPDSNQQVILYEDTHGDEEITFKGRLDPQGAFTGTWRGAGTSYPFSLKTDFSGAVRFDVAYGKDSVPLLANNPKSPKGDAANSIIWPVAGDNGSTADFIKAAITGGKAIQDPQQLIKRHIDSFLTAYKGSATTLDPADLKEESISASWNWTSEAEMKVVWNHYPLLVLAYSSYDFTGGAHGNGGTTHQVLDLAKQKVLSPDDVFKGDYKQVLTKELELAFRKTYQVPEGEPTKGMLLVESIEPNNNFILTNKGVVFSYTPYEIGPYALGQVNLFIPYERIKGVLKEDYSK